MKKMLSLLFVLAVVLTTTYYAIMSLTIKKYLPLPARSSLYLAIKIFPPKDFYEPIVHDDFLFNKNAYTATYSLNAKYANLYSLSIICDDMLIPKGYRFNGKLKVEYLWREKTIGEEIITSQISVWYRDDSTQFLKKIELNKFEIPILGKYDQNISIKITVLESDKKLAELSDKLQIHIAVSSTP